jgi:hypothetical protein
MPPPPLFVTLCFCIHFCCCLQRLADAFDLLSDDPPDLSGLHVLICGRTALDSQGTLCLDAAADVEDWAAFLGGVDTEYARDKKDSAAGLRHLEGRTAAAMGVRMLFTAAPYLMTHEYRQASRQLLLLCGHQASVSAAWKPQYSERCACVLAQCCSRLAIWTSC